MALESRNNGWVAIVDDEESVCSVFSAYLDVSSILNRAFSDPVQFMDQFRQGPAEVVLLDCRLSGVNGLDLIPELVEHNAEVKIIVTTGYADKDVAIRALKLGAFDFLEKPCHRELVCHAVQRAMEALLKQRQYSTLLNQVTQQKEELETLNSRLRETNRALARLAQGLDKEREDIEQRVAVKLRSLIIPAIHKIRRECREDRHAQELETLAAEIEGMTDCFTRNTPVCNSLLTQSEVRIVGLIKAGLTTEEIAERLSVSIITVKTHRRNIRKKMKINNTHHRLRDFLVSRKGFLKHLKQYTTASV